jgi:hypothetical protein
MERPRKIPLENKRDRPPQPAPRTEIYSKIMKHAKAKRAALIWIIPCQIKKSYDPDKYFWMQIADKFHANIYHDNNATINKLLFL